MSGLTGRQRDLLTFIKTYSETRGAAPSYDEMMDALGLKSKSGVHRLVSALVERGFISRMPNRTRSIGVTSNPNVPASLEAYATSDLIDELARRLRVLGAM